nr:uncharacterized protein LOC124217307 [Neodiprion pinetum]
MPLTTVAMAKPEAGISPVIRNPVGRDGNCLIFVEGKNAKHRQELDDDAASSSRNRKGDQTGSEGGGSKGGRSGKTEDGENIIEYRRSNKLFIELGWTILPKDTVMRRVVEFETEPAKPRMNWFKNNRMYGKQYYADGNTVFLNFLEDGTGHVYYPDGKIAIAAHISKEETHETYKVYSEGGRDLMGVVRAPWLMGVFDSMGNGVVYDENCKVRLSYNQNGGVFPENPSKVPFSWNWNNFQAPPIDQVVREEPPTVRLPPELVSAKEPTNSGSKSSKRSKSSKVTSCWKLSESGNMALNQKSKTIEPSNVIERKVIAPLKPICLKMNKYLSLRILDRKNINLQFFAGPKSIRIELGTEVNPNVQINSELVDRNDWTAKMTNWLTCMNYDFLRSKYDVDSNLAKVDPSKVEDSLVEIAKEIERVKTEANSRRLMIAKYRPHLIDKSS